MMRTSRLLIPVLLAAGCSHVDVLVYTQVEEDGTVVRTLAADYVGDIDESKEPGLPRELSLPQPGFAVATLTATHYEVEGRFEPGSPIPRDFIWLPDSDELHPRFRFCNRVDVDSEDLVLLRVFRYRESFTGAVTAGEFDGAANRFLAFAVDFAMQCADRVYGDDYDVEGMRPFLACEVEPEVMRLFIGLFDFFATHKVSRHPDGEDAWRRALDARIRESASALGLEIDVHGNDEALMRSAGQVFDARVAPWLRPRGADIPPLTFARVLEDSEKLQIAAHGILAERYGGGDLGVALLEDFLPPGLAALLLSSVRLPYKFEAAVSLPGEILRTNGVWLAPGRAYFHFQEFELFPDGYELSADSFVPNDSVQTRLLGRVALTDPGEALEFVERIEGMEKQTREAALAALRAAREGGAIEALGALEREPGVNRAAVSSLRAALEAALRF